MVIIMFNLEVFKQQNKHVTNRINRYKPIIIEFLNKLKNKNLINTREVRTKLKKFGIIANASMTLTNRSDIKRRYIYLVAICNAYQLTNSLVLVSI